jgi:hypothetical protein
MPRRVPGLLLAALVAAASTGSAQEPDPLAAVEDADPMALARVLDRLGDDAVLERLGGDAAPAARLAAIRAAPFMTGPELALEPLGALAAGRHPHLAPEASRAALAIARDLDAADLARREQPADTLAPAAAAFGALADDATARPDLRTAATQVVARLRAAGVPTE